MRYAGTVQNTATAGAAPSVEILAPPGKVIRVVSINAQLTGATFCPWAIGRSGAPGVPSTSLRGVSAQGNRLSQTVLATAWSQAPTVPPIFLAWLFVQGAIGATLIWTPSQAVEAGSLVVWNANAVGSGGGFTVEWDED